MKKLTSLFLAVVMCLLSMSVVFAEDLAQVKVGDATICVDEEQVVTVPLQVLSNTLGFAGFNIDVEYDTRYFTLTPADPEDPSSSVVQSFDLLAEVIINSKTPGRINLQFARATLVTKKTQTLANITFKISEDCPAGEYPIKVTTHLLSTSDGNETADLYEVPREDVNGIITVTRLATPAPVPAVVESVGMVDTTDVEGPNKSITSFMTTINTNDESVNALTWNISYDGKSKSFAKKYDTTFTGTVKLGLYVENLYVADESALDVSVEF